MTQTAEPRTEPENRQVSGFDRYFGITAHGSNIPRELRAGFTTWLTMSYILFVNPQVLSAPSTCRTPSTSCDHHLPGRRLRLAGDGDRRPLSVRPGPRHGPERLLRLLRRRRDGLPWQTALGAVFISGALFVILSVAGARQASSRRSRSAEVRHHRRHRRLPGVPRLQSPPASWWPTRPPWSAWAR